MTVPSIIWILIFCYYPMYGVLIAFKRFSYKEGIWGSPWVGLENFQFLFNYNGVGRVFFNTVFLNILFLARHHAAVHSFGAGVRGNQT